MNFRFAALSVLVLGFPLAAFADEAVLAAPMQAAASGVAPSTVVADDAENNKVICKREAQVGSLIASRICKTAAQWQLDRDNARKTVGDLQQHTGSTGSK